MNLILLCYRQDKWHKMQYNVLAPLDTSVFVSFLVPSLQNQLDYCIHVTFTHTAY